MGFGVDVSLEYYVKSKRLLDVYKGSYMRKKKIQPKRELDPELTVQSMVAGLFADNNSILRIIL